jgi:uncharacterized iron-regulated membrane protein
VTQLDPRSAACGEPITEGIPPQAPPDIAQAAKRLKKKTAARGWRKPFVVTHRWVALFLGLLLLAITTTGALLLYRPEIVRATHSNLYNVTSTAQPVGFQQALDAAHKAYPKSSIEGAQLDHGIYAVSADDYEKTIYVDSGNGHVNGMAGEYEGAVNWTFGLMDQIHECFFSCEGMPAYVPFLNDNPPSLGWSALSALTWGTILLGGIGLVLIFMAVGGIIVWWPKRGAVKKSLVIERGRSGLLRHRQVHQVVGMAAIPLLLMWGVTGAAFELPFVADAWYAITPGGEPADVTLTSEEAKTPDIGVAKAEAAALAATGGGKIFYVAPPVADDPTATYDFYIQKGWDSYDYSLFAGNVGVSVDRHSAVTALTYGDPSQSKASWLLDYSEGLHRGYPLNGWWRSILFVFGLTPLLMGFTGFFMWRHKRKRRVEGKKRRKAVAQQAVAQQAVAQQAAAAANQAAPPVPSPA